MIRNSFLQLRKFVAPEIIFGTGALELAGQYAKKFGSSKVLIVTDPGVQKAGWTKRVEDSVTKAGLSHSVYAGITPNPRENEIMAGVERFREEECDCIIAIGGGSPIDSAKGIGIVCSNKRHILDFEGVDRVLVPMPPIICIPTTGGTSADVSQFAIIMNTRRKTKIAIISKAIVPDVALVDPVTLTTMDSYLTACTGLDALAHAIEAFVSNANSPMTDLHALEAVRLISKNLLHSLLEPDNVDLRSKLMLGSLEAGLAFSNASLGAVHAMAHSLGGYLDLAHGECNAMLLRHVVDYNFIADPARYREVGKALGINLRGMRDMDVRTAILNAIDALRTRGGIKETLGQKGVKAGDIPALSLNAIADPCIVTNPRECNQRDIEVIYEEAL